MSGFFSLLSALAFLALIVFLVQARQRRPGAGRRAWGAAGAMMAAAALGSGTQTDAERATSAGRAQAASQARQLQASRDTAAQQAAAGQRAAEQAERERAEAERRANTSIEPAAMQVYCEKEARARLKLPDTARFPGLLEKADNQPIVGPQGAIWRSWVEGENAFGGKVRDHFTCIYTRADNSLSLEFQGQ